MVLSLLEVPWLRSKVSHNARAVSRQSEAFGAYRLCDRCPHLVSQNDLLHVHILVATCQLASEVSHVMGHRDCARRWRIAGLC
jgi:hypothetical protein